MSRNQNKITLQPIFKEIYTLIMIGILLVTANSFAGSFTPAPAIPGAGDYTLSDIFNKISSSTYSYSSHIFEPTETPNSTLVTLSDIWDAIRWSTLNNSGILDAGIYVTSSLSVAEPNLVASNISSSASIFGVDGSCRGIPTDGLISYWSFDDGTASDPIGGYDGTIDGAIPTTGLGGTPDTAFRFDGLDDRIDWPVSILDSVRTQTGTWCTWLYSVDLLDNRKVMMFGDSTKDSYVQLELNSTQGLRAKSRNPAGNVAWQINVNSPPSGDPFVFVCLVHDGSEPSIYVNGAKPAQTFMTSLDKTIWLGDIPGIDRGQIGCADKNEAVDAWHPLLGHDYYRGTIDEVRVYDRDLSAQEMLDIYNITKP